MFKKLREQGKKVVESSSALQVVTGGVSAFANDVSFKNEPQSLDQLHANRRRRAEIVIDLQVKSHKIGTQRPENTAASQRFWANQAYFMLDMLNAYLTSENKNFAQECQTQERLLVNLSEFYNFLKDNPTAALEFIFSYLDDAQVDSTIEQSVEDDVAEQAPKLFTANRHAVVEAINAAKSGRRVLLINAKSAMRPNPGLQSLRDETHTIAFYSDTCLKVLKQFRDVDADLFAEGDHIFQDQYSSNPSANLNRPSVESAQVNYVMWLIAGVYEYIRNPENLKHAQFRQPLYNFTGELPLIDALRSKSLEPGLICRLQNEYYEIPADGGYHETCYVHSIRDLNHEMFVNSNRTLNSVWADMESVKRDSLGVFHLSLPDARPDEGRYAYGCTASKKYKNKQDARQHFQTAFSRALQTGIDGNYDVIVFDSLACQKYRQDITNVAGLISNCLNKYASQLKGKEIFFLDTRQHTVRQGEAFIWVDNSDKFSTVFRQQLARDFQIESLSAQEILFPVEIPLPEAEVLDSTEDLEPVVEDNEPEEYATLTP